MFALGIVFLLAGFILRIFLVLSSRSRIRSLSPLRVSVREMEIRNIKEKQRFSDYNSILLIVSGAILVMLTAVLN